MDEFIQLIIFAAIILLSAVFGRKKKKPGGSAPTAPKAPRPRPEVASATREAPSKEQPRHVVRAERPRLEPRKQPGSFREFFDLLQQQAETATRGEPLVLEEALEPPPLPPAPVRRERPPGPQSLETEAAGVRSHSRFHDKYLRPLDAVPENRPPRFILPRDPVSLKRAVIWSEILGSPKGME
jgi:hypothetical protein